MSTTPDGGTSNPTSSKDGEVDEIIDQYINVFVPSLVNPTEANLASTKQAWNKAKLAIEAYTANRVREELVNLRKLAISTMANGNVVDVRIIDHRIRELHPNPTEGDAQGGTADL